MEHSPFHFLILLPSLKLSSEFEVSPDVTWHSIDRLSRDRHYALSVAAVTGAGRGNASQPVSVQPAINGKRSSEDVGNKHTTRQHTPR